MPEWNPVHMRKADDPQWNNPPPFAEATEAHRIAMLRAPDVMAVRAQVAFKQSPAGQALAAATTVEARAAAMREILQSQGLAVPVGAVGTVAEPAVAGKVAVGPVVAPSAAEVIAEIQAAAAAEKGSKR